jgi:hypothetical protein
MLQACYARIVMESIRATRWIVELVDYIRGFIAYVMIALSLPLVVLLAGVMFVRERFFNDETARSRKKREKRNEG